MNQARAPVGVAHYYQRLAELATLPFWQLPDFGEPSGPNAGTSGTGRTSIPSSPGPATSRTTRPSCSAVLIFSNPGLTMPKAGTTPTIAAAHQMLFPGERAPVHARSMSDLRFGLAGEGVRMSHKCPFAGR